MKRHWTSLAFLLMALQWGSIRAQTTDNMVFNPSFEEHLRCPERIDALGVMTDVEAWWQPTGGSSDYFHICGGRDCGVPRNKLGVQTAHSGDAYCGIYCSQENYREYLQTELKEPLKAGRRYHVSFWVSLADKSPHAVATLGALFTTERISDTSWGLLMHKEIVTLEHNENQVIATPYNAQVANGEERVLDNDKEWVEVSGEMTASGGERFLTLGNFRTFNHSNVRNREQINAILQGAYYYIDDVSVTALDEDKQPAKPQPKQLPEEGQVVTLWNLFFATGKSEVLPQSHNELYRLRRLMEENPTMKIELRGHTDNQGTSEFNRRLSEARAQAVADYLVAHGIDKARLTTVGFGKTMPIDSNDTAEGRSRNRRVEYRVLTK